MTRDNNWQRPASLEAFGAAIRRRREEMDLTLDRLAARTGISKPYLSNIETGHTPGPASPEKLARIAKTLKLDARQVLAGADWLRTPASVRRLVASESAETGGETTGKTLPRRADGTIDLDRLMPAGIGTRGSPARPADKRRRREEPLLPVRAVPLINRVAAGKAAEFTDLSYPAGVADDYVAAPDLPETPVAAAFALRVVGDSMMPDYREGEILIVGPAGAGGSAAGAATGAGEPQDGQDCVVRLGENENFATTFKRVYFEREGDEAVAVRLVPLNPAYAERRVTMEEVTGIYPVIYRLVPARRETRPAAEAPAAQPSFTSSRVSLEND